MPSTRRVRGLTNWNTTFALPKCEVLTVDHVVLVPTNVMPVAQAFLHVIGRCAEGVFSAKREAQASICRAAFHQCLVVP